MYVLAVHYPAGRVYAGWLVPGTGVDLWRRVCRGVRVWGFARDSSGGRWRRLPFERASARRPSLAGPPPPSDSRTMVGREVDSRLRGWCAPHLGVVYTSIVLMSTVS
jgi:hypothetical protein